MIPNVLFMTVSQTGLSILKYLFDLPDFLLDFAGEFFAPPFGCQVRVVRDLSRFFFDVALNFVQLAFDLIRCARFHPLVLTPQSSIFEAVATLRFTAPYETAAKLKGANAQMSDETRRTAGTKPSIMKIKSHNRRAAARIALIRATDARFLSVIFCTWRSAVRDGSCGFIAGVR